MSAAREWVRLAGVALGAASLVVGAAIGAGYVADVVAERDQLRAQVQAGRPAAAAPPPARVTPTPSPSPTRAGRSFPVPAVTRTVQTVSVRAPGPSRTGGGGSANGGGGGTPPSAPSTPPPQCSGGRIVSVSVSIALLPCDAIKIGGRR